MPLRIASSALVLVVLFCAGPPASARAAADTAATVDPSLLDTLRVLSEARAFARVDSLAGAAVRDGRFGTRADSVVLGDLLAARVRARFGMGLFTDSTTFALGLRAIEVKGRASGPEAITTAGSIHDFGTLMYRRGRFEESIAHLERARGIYASADEPDEQLIARVDYTLGSVLKRAGDYDRAETYILSALEARKRLADGFDTGVALSLNQLANLHSSRGKPHESIPAYREAIAILEGREEEYAHFYGPFMANLASELRIVGRYDEARRTYAVVNRVLATAYGPDDPRLTASLEGQAILLMKYAEYAEARRLLNRALAIVEMARGPDHFEVAITLDNLEIVESALGNLEKAEELALRSLAIKVASYGTSHAQVALSLNNLGVLFRRMGEYGKARDYVERALEMRRELLGDEHPLVASTLINMGNVHSHTGDTEQAMASYREAARIYRDTYGERSPIYATTIQSIAREHWIRGDYDEAIPILRKEIGILGDAFGSSHPLVAEARHLLADCHLRTGDRQAAFREALAGENETRNVLRSCFRSLPEGEALRYAESRPQSLGIAMELWNDGLPGAGSVAELWDSVIKSRGLLFDELSARRRFLAEADDPEVERLFHELARATRRVANLVVHGPEGLTPEQYTEYVEVARAERHEWERRCEERSRYYRADRAQARVGYADVVRALGEDQALVGIRRYLRGDPANDRAVSFYTAFVKPGGGEPPVAVPLGAAAEIDFLASLWRAEVDRGFAGDPDLARRAGEKLRERVWDPIAAHLGGISLAWFVPDGAFHTIALDALPAPGGGYLVEQPLRIQLLSTERDLAPRNVDRKPGSGVLVVGAPDFDRRVAAVDRLPAGPVRDSKPAREPDPVEVEDAFEIPASLPRRAAVCREFRALSFSPLPASAREARNIASVWERRGADGDVKSLIGADADERRFKEEAAGRRHIHVATHAFFLGEECGTRTPGSARAVSSAGVSQRISPGLSFDLSSAVSTSGGLSPLLLSGLAFAGSNARDALDLESDDGVLTAEEIAALNLRGVDAAVLSGCETGGGVVRLGEGVFGLRRAFQLAGVRTLVMSLWRIEDEWARRWMEAYYDANWGRGLSPAEAVRDANRTVLAARRAAGESDHPFFWAGFVAVGR